MTINVTALKLEPLGSCQPRFEAWLRNVATAECVNFDYICFISGAKIAYSGTPDKVTTCGTIIDHDDFTMFVHSYAKGLSND